MRMHQSTQALDVNTAESSFHGSHGSTTYSALETQLFYSFIHLFLKLTYQKEWSSWWQYWTKNYNGTISKTDTGQLEHWITVDGKWLNRLSKWKLISTNQSKLNQPASGRYETVPVVNFLPFVINTDISVINLCEESSGIQYGTEEWICIKTRTIKIIYIWRYNYFKGGGVGSRVKPGNSTLQFPQV